MTNLKTFSKKELFTNMNVCKKDIAIKAGLLAKNGGILVCFDYALPQHWLDDFAESTNLFSYDEIRCTTFMIYPPENRHGQLFSVCKEINDLINAF